MTTAPDSIVLQHHRAELARSQANLRRSLQQLEDAAREELDIARRLAEYAPIVALAGFGLGIWLGSRPSFR